MLPCLPCMPGQLVHHYTCTCFKTRAIPCTRHRLLNAYAALRYVSHDPAHRPRKTSISHDSSWEKPARVPKFHHRSYVYKVQLLLISVLANSSVGRALDVHAGVPGSNPARVLTLLAKVVPDRVCKRDFPNTRILRCSGRKACIGAAATSCISLSMFVERRQ
jgi:hypothetical protein